jgi:ankyrin repeat protein
VRAIRFYLPEELRSEGNAAIQNAQRWLIATHPESTEDATFRLLGLVWSDAGPAEIDTARRDLIAFQKSDGWPELPGYPPDAYSTGEALFALHEAGTPATDPSWRKGLRFLVSTQALDGSWRVHTRMLSPAQVSPAYFSTGFPYQKDEYLSYAGSCWAVMAILTALPESSPAPEPPRSSLSDAAPWVRTALFGNAQQLAAQLDAGLDPNGKTDGGTTVLMMAAPDPAKVRLLLARGADVKARAPSGADALTIAAANRGDTESLQLLLNAGAEVQAPQGTRGRQSPLLLASMTGDIENVKLLLAHGADPNKAPNPQANTPLAAAVTFGYADVSQTLIAAGANATLTEATGINLLHWAVITGRPMIIPLLVKAGASVNSVDESGYTPLMYAATIDFGDAELVKALLKAGADSSKRNDDGRTPREQARYFHHSTLEAALRP